MYACLYTVSISACLSVYTVLGISLSASLSTVSNSLSVFLFTLLSYILYLLVCLLFLSLSPWLPTVQYQASYVVLLCWLEGLKEFGK